MPNLSVEATHSVKEQKNSSFFCYNEPPDEALKPNVIKLYLTEQNLKISCYVYDVNLEDTLENRRRLLLLYTSAGLTPSIQIFNSTYSKVFYFKMKLEENQTTWTIDIPRQNITYNTDVASIEEWFVNFMMHYGLNKFTTKGTLLDTLREPLLQWQLGEPVSPDEISSLIPYVRGIKLSKRTCANDVALLALVCNGTVEGIYLGITDSGFTFRDTKWYNLTDRLCSLMDDDCVGLSLVNILLTNNNLIILTTLGLFISQDLRYPTGSPLKFTKPRFCGFEWDDYFSADTWYNVQCLANQGSYEVDYISLSFKQDKTLSQVSTCFYSYDPFKEWYSCLPYRTQDTKKFSGRVVAFLIDYQQDTAVALITIQNKAKVSVYKITDHKLHTRTKFPSFWFPDTKFFPTGMFFHPNSHFLYVYGNQVWFSDDGGNTFVLLLNLKNEIVVKINTCVYSQSITFVTNKGSIFYTKAGFERYAKLTTSQHSVFTLYFDHLGALHLIVLNESDPDCVDIDQLDFISLLQETDLGFDNPLVLQYVTEEQVIFFQHIALNNSSSDRPEPRFTHVHKDQILIQGSVGSGVIVNIFQHDHHPYYLSSIILDILKKFHIESEIDSPCAVNVLTIFKESDSSSVRLHISKSEEGKNFSISKIFMQSDIEKSVVIPGYSSFLIIEIKNDLNALAHPTMPDKVPFNKSFQPYTWFLYDFGTKNERQWKIKVDDCRYWIQEVSELPKNAIKYMDLGEVNTFTFRVTPVDTGFPVFHIPLMKVVVGNPSLVEVETKEYWDDTDSYIIEFSVISKFYKQGKSSVAVILTRASLICDISTFVITLKTACSYGKSMHYIPPVTISSANWLHGDPKDDHGFKLLTQLPVNYRPPSVLGIAVPLTDNFYNADPSKPRMRDYFEKSKTSGTYKKCANKSSRAKCNCTDNEKLSFSVAFSDCKEKAFRMKYPVRKLPIYFIIKSKRGYKDLTSPYFVTITEVNQRTNWEVAGTNATPSMLKMRAYLKGKLNATLYNPDALTLNIYGSELFHFRVSVIPGVSFCNLFDEFQIYVDDAPLAFPGQYLTISLTAVLIGGIIFVTFMVQVYDVNIWKKIKSRSWRKNKIGASETRTTDTDNSASS
ncbi:cation channel sperm-associated auxiliary subunit beta [Alligator mississippiensis]|uniref:cation channel sperm-associated auxiliary subunit beta n=1 Tax=Alligator mississippiensis TaxID=8496 RepID=UPI002877C025|nr:cation channel sperm-associated auxiliary subunit beta [Alligator mississippiensis]